MPPPPPPPTLRPPLLQPNPHAPAHNRQLLPLRPPQRHPPPPPPIVRLLTGPRSPCMKTSSPSPPAPAYPPSAQGSHAPSSGVPLPLHPPRHTPQSPPAPPTTHHWVLPPGWDRPCWLRPSTVHLPPRRPPCTRPHLGPKPPAPSGWVYHSASRSGLCATRLRVKVCPRVPSTVRARALASQRCTVTVVPGSYMDRTTDN